MKNQHMDWKGNVKKCGSCWTFATAGSIESARAIKGLPLIELSEQMLIDCDRSMGGCQGGSVPRGYDFTHEAGGLVSEQD